MDHRRFARTVFVCCAAGAAASLAVFEAAPIVCLAFLTVTEGRPARVCVAAGTALLGAWLFLGGPWLLAAMGVAFALSVAPPRPRLVPNFAETGAAGVAAALAAGVALAAPSAATLADSITGPAAGAAFGLWLSLCTLPLHRIRRPPPTRERPPIPARDTPIFAIMNVVHFVSEK